MTESNKFGLLVSLHLGGGTLSPSHNTCNHWFHVLSRGGGNPVFKGGGGLLQSCHRSCPGYPDCQRSWQGVPQDIAPCLGLGTLHLGMGYPSPHLRLGYPSGDWVTLICLRLDIPPELGYPHLPETGYPPGIGYAADCMPLAVSRRRGFPVFLSKTNCSRMAPISQSLMSEVKPIESNCH